MYDVASAGLFLGLYVICGPIFMFFMLNYAQAKGLVFGKARPSSPAIETGGAGTEVASPESPGVEMDTMAKEAKTPKSQGSSGQLVVDPSQTSSPKARVRVKSVLRESGKALSRHDDHVADSQAVFLEDFKRNFGLLYGTSRAFVFLNRCL